jgi:hypothetical protein
MSRSSERVLGWSALAVGVALAVVGALNLLAEGTAADLEHRGAQMTLAHWPLLFAGLVVVGVGIVLVARAVARDKG